jgi:hypothetical protein
MALGIFSSSPYSELKGVWIGFISQAVPLVRTEFNIRTEHAQRTVLNARTDKQVQNSSVEYSQLSSRTVAYPC